MLRLFGFWLSSLRLHILRQATQHLFQWPHSPKQCLSCSSPLYGTSEYRARLVAARISTSSLDRSPVIIPQSHLIVRLWNRAIYADFAPVRLVSRFLCNLSLQSHTTYIRPLWDWSYDRWCDRWCDHWRFTSDCFKIYLKISCRRPRLTARLAATSGTPLQSVVRLVVTRFSD